jgi:hypothetical protein
LAWEVRLENSAQKKYKGKKNKKTEGEGDHGWVGSFF